MAFEKYDEYVNGRNSGLRKGDKLSDPLVPLFTAKLHLKLARELENASNIAFREFSKALTGLHEALVGFGGERARIEGRARQHVMYRLHASRLKILLSLDSTLRGKSEIKYFGEVLELLESYNDSTFWVNPIRVSSSSAALRDSLNGIDKAFCLDWIPSGTNSLEERKCVILCDCLRQLHRILDHNVFFHRARILLAETYLGKCSRTTALEIAEAAGMPAEMMEMHLSPQRARTLVDYLFQSANKRQRGTNPVRVWKDDGRDRGTAYLMVRLDQECERKYDRVRARCVCAVIRAIESQGDYPSIAYVLKKLRLASSAMTQLFQKLICLTVQSMGRLILNGCASSASISSTSVSNGPWLKRALTLFLQTCQFNEFYTQPHSEGILLKAYAAVHFKSTSDPRIKNLTLRRVVKNLAKTYPEMQAIAIAKRSRLKLRSSFPREHGK
jgi:hypothetical protein